jgi:hypothetical protein
MGADIVFYIQKKNDKDKWEDIELFTKDNKRVEISRCGWDTVDMLKDTWGTDGITGEDVEKLAKATGWITDIDDAPLCYWVTLTKLELFGYYKKFNSFYTEDEAEEAREFYKELEKEIKQYITFADEDYFNTDNIRIVAFISC